MRIARPNPDVLGEVQFVRVLAQREEQPFGARYVLEGVRRFEPASQLPEGALEEELGKF
jgi:hypothetical protein